MSKVNTLVAKIQNGHSNASIQLSYSVIHSIIINNMAMHRLIKTLKVTQRRSQASSFFLFLFSSTVQRITNQFGLLTVLKCTNIKTSKN